MRFSGGGLKFSIFSFSGGGGTCTHVPVWKSKDNLWELMLFHHVRLGLQSSVGLGNSTLSCPLFSPSHFSSSLRLPFHFIVGKRIKNVCDETNQPTNQVFTMKDFQLPKDLGTSPVTSTLALKVSSQDCSLRLLGIYEESILFRPYPRPLYQKLPIMPSPQVTPGDCISQSRDQVLGYTFCYGWSMKCVPQASGWKAWDRQGEVFGEVLNSSVGNS